MDYNFHDKIPNYSFCEIHLIKLLKYPDKSGFATLLEKLINIELNQIERINFLNFRKNYNKYNDKNCFLCEKINESSFLNYENTIQRWIKDENFYNLFKTNNKMCQRHFYDLYKISKKVIFKNKLSFQNILHENQKRKLIELKKDIKLYLEQFDHNKKKDQKETSKKSLYDIINILKK